MAPSTTRLGCFVKVLAILATMHFYSALSVNTTSDQLGGQNNIKGPAFSAREIRGKPPLSRRGSTYPTRRDSHVTTDGQCGGFVELTGQSIDLRYEIPQDLQSVSCIWILWSKYGRNIRIKNVVNAFDRNKSNFELQALYNLPKNGTSMDLGDVDETLTLNVNDEHGYAILFFNGNQTNGRSQGFHIKVSETGKKWIAKFFPLQAEFIELQDPSGYLKYPSQRDSQYKDNERLFLIGRVPEGKSLKWQLNYNIERNSDWLGLFWLNGSTWNRYM